MFCIFTRGAMKNVFELRLRQGFRNQFLSPHSVESAMFYGPSMIKTFHK